MTKYENLLAQLNESGSGIMKCFGNSMLPILSNPSTNTYRREKEYRVGDIVFCKVRGRFVDAHLVIAKDGDRYLIANNHGHQNGWTRAVFGRVVSSTDSSGKVRHF